jgi:hypothetical protein
MKARCSVALAAMCGLGGPAIADWPTYQGNAAHTGYVPGVLNVAPFEELWSTPVSPNQLSGLAVGGGTVFVTNLGSFVNVETLHALDEATGGILWAKTFGSSNATTSAPGYANGSVVLQTDSYVWNYLHAYEARSGALVFESPYAAQWETYLNPTPYEGNIYVGGGYTGGMYSFSASGTENWFAYGTQYWKWTPAVDAGRCYSYAGSGNTEPIQGKFHVVDRIAGSTLHIVTDTLYQRTNGEVNTSVVLGTNSAAFSTNEPGMVGQVYSPYGRLIRWDLRDDATHTPRMDWAISDRFTGQVSLAAGVLYVNNAGVLQARDEVTGALLWSWTAPSGPIAGPMIVTDNVILACTSVATHAVGLTSHATEWTFPAHGILGLSDGMLFIAGTDLAVHAVGVPCYANCDHSTAPPILNAADFTCFLSQFAGSDPHANCDGSTTAPTLNVHDFICFVNKFSLGCP